MKAGLVEHWLSIKNVLKQTYQPLFNFGENDGLIGTSTERQNDFEALEWVEWVTKVSLEADKEEEQSLI